MSQSRGRLLAAGLSMTLLTSAYYRTNTSSTMSQTARAFLASLSDEQKTKTRFRFGDEERFFWHYIPSDDIPRRYNKPRMGLTLAEMTPPQRHLASALLGAGLSQAGLIKVTQIMSLEDILRVMEKDTAGRRDSDKYHFSVFGEPAESGTWGYRIEGHHVSLHFTIVNGKVAGAPTFLGANPHLVKEGPRTGLRVLGPEEDLARELLETLSDEQKKIAIVSATAYRDILTEASRKAALEGQPNGLAAAKMNTKQRELLESLLAEYANNLPEEIAQARMAKVKKAGTNLYFAWAGPTGRGEPHYYRVMSPTFLVEYDNTQNGANHSHTVWREQEGDFGLDLLKAHYDSAHKR